MELAVVLCSPDSQEEIDCYINACSFLAQLSAAGEAYISMVIWTFRRNFEEDRSDDTSEHFSGDVAGCKMWIIYAGQWLFQQMIHSPRPLSSFDKDVWKGGTLYSGPVLDLARWRFWRKGLESASEGTQLTDKTKSLVQKAIVLMDAIEHATV
ncbi:hypothetical protein N7540_004789 [Penicillium herquei]|nr:hypothetical protein N7540_004789 [Penicillium herquei]